MQGFAGWVWSLVEGWRGQRSIQQKQLRVVETLSLGGKRQLMLVSCGGESFLVGGGLDSVEAIVRLKGELPVDVLRRIRMSHANDVPFAMDSVGDGWADDASAMYAMLRRTRPQIAANRSGWLHRRKNVSSGMLREQARAL